MVPGRVHGPARRRRGRPAQGVEKKIKEWGHRLHDAIFGPPENAQSLKTLLDAPEPRKLTIATKESALLRLPWELMRDQAGSLAQRSPCAGS